MRIWTRPLMGTVPGKEELFDTGQDEVIVDDGLCVALVGRNPDDTVCYIGRPSAELQMAITKHFGIDRKVSWPSVILDRHKNPITASEYDDE